MVELQTTKNRWSLAQEITDAITYGLHTLSIYIVTHIRMWISSTTQQSTCFSYLLCSFKKKHYTGSMAAITIFKKCTSK